MKFNGLLTSAFAYFMVNNRYCTDKYINSKKKISIRFFPFFVSGRFQGILFLCSSLILCVVRDVVPPIIPQMHFSLLFSLFLPFPLSFVFLLYFHFNDKKCFLNCKVSSFSYFSFPLMHNCENASLPLYKMAAMPNCLYIG